MLDFKEFNLFLILELFVYKETVGVLLECI